MQVTLKKQHRASAVKLTFFIVTTGPNQTFTTDPFEVDIALVTVSFKGDSTNSWVESSLSAKRSDTAPCQAVKLSIRSDNCDRDLIVTHNWSESLVLQPRAADLMGRANVEIKSFILEVTVTAQDASSVILFNKLYDDKDYTDFQMRAPDGTVDVHKVVLASHSELFKSLQSAESRENFGEFRIPGVTKQTLQHLKDYMYLGTLPTSELPLLLLVAIKGGMKKLKSDCVEKLASVVSAEDLDTLIDFAVANSIPELLRAMLSHTSDSAVHGAHLIRKNKLRFRALNMGRLSLEP